MRIILFSILISILYSLSSYHKRLPVRCQRFCLAEDSPERVTRPKHVPNIPVLSTQTPLQFIPYNHNFVIVQKVAEGASAEVYVVQDYKTHQLKILKRYFETEDKTSFEAENYIIQQLNHNIQWAKDPYHDEVVSIHPFNDVVNLSDIRVTSREVKIIMYKLLKEVNQAHQKGIIHSDIKPENILIDAKRMEDFLVTEKMIVDLIDWNLAAFYYPGKAFSRASGTPPFKAPELTFFTEYFSPVVDVWSLGAVMYQLITRQALVPSDFEDEVYQLIKVFGFQRMLNLYEALSPRADPFVMHQIIDGEDLNETFTQKMSLDDFNQQQKRFIQKMLVVEPWNRPSCQQLLADEYFNDILMFDTSMAQKSKEREQKMEEQSRQKERQRQKKDKEREQETPDTETPPELSKEPVSEDAETTSK